jgi:hypothetical protein
VCARASSYACPGCLAAYCSAPCFAAHGARCTERFFRREVSLELRLRASEDSGSGAGTAAGGAGDARARAVSALVRDPRGGPGAAAGGGIDGDEEVEEDYALSDDEAAPTRLARLALAAAVGGDDAHELLTPDERRRARRAAARGGLREPGHTVRLDHTQPAPAAWAPWWSQSLTQHRLAVAAVRATADADGAATEGDATGDVSDSDDGINDGALPPSPPCVGTAAPGSWPPPSLASLLPAGRQPSPLLRFNLANVLIAYAHTVRLFAGDHAIAGQAADAAAVLLAVSGVLADDVRHASVAAACAAALEASHAPGVRRTALPDRRTALELLEDVAELLREPHFVVDALFDAGRLCTAALAELHGEGRRATDQSFKAQLRSAAHKLLFFSSWAFEALVRTDALVRVSATTVQHFGPSAAAPASARQLPTVLLQSLSALEGAPRRFESDFDRIAAGVESGAAVCNALRAEVCAVLDAHLDLVRGGS